MKNVFLFFCCLMLSHLSSAQTDAKDAQKAFEDYFEVLHNKDFEHYLDYIYPKLFELAPREAIEAAIKKQFSDTTVFVTMSNTKVNKVSKVLEMKKVKYILLDYEFDMQLTLNNPEDTAYEAAKMTHNIFVEVYGKKNVQYDGKDHFDIHASKKSIGILDPAYDGWKFIDKNENPMLSNLLPKKVLKKLK